jgi:hypothetical protein
VRDADHDLAGVGPISMARSSRPRRASGRATLTLSIISRNAVRTERGSRMFRRTPPTSDLCVMSGELIFIATGSPTLSAAISASAAECTLMLGVVGMWKAFSTALDSALLSVKRRSPIACSIIRRAPSTSDSRCRDSGSGAWSSAFWLRR